MSYWDDIEREIADTEAADGARGRPDPWADRDADSVSLTDEQIAFLEALVQQPKPPRLSDPKGTEPTPP